MWRAFFLAIGLSLIILGAEFLIVDQVILRHPRSADATLAQVMDDSDRVASSKAFEPPDWFPWSLFSVGAIVMIYSFTIPKRVKD